ncbi:hypothetical protein C8R45DRAFT_144846 [Mycena sanguinolenta]|nr:hypothetical protein C8R45DRAFT_144846 [Mycena sanguinolenta]
MVLVPSCPRPWAGPTRYHCFSASPLQWQGGRRIVREIYTLGLGLSRRLRCHPLSQQTCQRFSSYGAAVACAATSSQPCANYRPRWKCPQSHLSASVFASLPPAVSPTLTRSRCGYHLGRRGARRLPRPRHATIIGYSYIFPSCTLDVPRTHRGVFDSTLVCTK